MNELHLFAGAGGGILGGILLGHRTVCAVELEPYCRKVLLQRQRDGILPKFPIWDDICTFDGTPWKGKVDIVCGGFPCQDISAAGKGAGITGERSGLWSEMARIIGEIRPKYAFVENSPMLVGRGLTRVIGDLAEMGYNASWIVLGASDVGANHKRERIWILATDSMCKRWQGIKVNRCIRKSGSWCDKQFARLLEDSAKLAIPTSSGRGIHDGVASKVDRLKAIGNGQVPAVAATAFRILKGE